MHEENEGMLLLIAAAGGANTPLRVLRELFVSFVSDPMWLRYFLRCSRYVRLNA